MAELKIYFKEPLIEMRFGERVFVRVIENIFLTVFIVTTFALIISPIKSFFWMGALMPLIVLDKFIHSGKSRKSLFYLPNSGLVNVADYLSPHAMEAIIIAHEKWSLEHGDFHLRLAASLLNDNEVKEAIKRLDVNVAEFEKKINDGIQTSSKIYTHPEITEAIDRISTNGLRVAVDANADFIGCGDLFASLAKSSSESVSKILSFFEIRPEDLEKALIFGRFNRFGFFSHVPKAIGGFASRKMRSRVVNRAWTSRPTPTLDSYSIDQPELTKVGNIGFMIGHTEEYERLLNVLSKRSRPNALLVGEPGIGKGAVVAHLAYNVSKDKVPAPLFDKRIVGLDISRLLSGADEPALQKRIQEIFSEIYAAGNIILYIPEVHNLARTAGEDKINALNIIIPLILENNFPVIATTYPKEYKQYIESDRSLLQAFEPIRINELSVDDALKVLIYQSFFFEKDHKLTITFGALRRAVELAKKYFNREPLPSSAAGLLKEALVSATRRNDRLLSADDVIAVAETRVKIPIRGAEKDEAEKLLNLEEIIHRDLVDQEVAVEAVSEALRAYRSGLSRKGGPIGTFLFVGPTGVGKTELSKILARVQFGSADSMIRFDMSQYQDKQSVFQFIGSPDGKMAGLLTDQVLDKPYSLILLDEFEKAHPDILNLFLQVFDDGRLTDNFGRVVNFENTIIIATSNAHSEFVKAEIEKGRDIKEIGAELKNKLTVFFKPELLNRFSSIVVFRNLRPEDIKLITERQLKALSRDLAENKNISLSFSEEAVSKIATLGYDPVFGARPLREVISNYVKDPLSKIILRGNLGRGAQIRVELDEDQIKLRENG